ncbi:uncharacterized protein N7459_005532 [Penicillium hispanicum]|uniref:uncharacterized protein n=1 Tax=Penicillium hispanicum TaxID=1080232 RepID=UPI00253FF587|nr:uncharacterized protein N7459_005532 [Penicillium hispanicum]KAJ5579547.1 hypothetical protein N7459_005532 [Penicillium hispanicum]
MAAFDPNTQQVTFRYANGHPFNVSVSALDEFAQYNVRVCINYGCQLGASIVLLVILLLLTRREKRASAVFLLNGLALLFNITRLLFEVIHFTTGFEHVYPYFSYDYSSVKRSAYVISVLSVVLETLLVICVESSLVLQVQVVCATLRRRYRRALLGVSVLMALVPIGFRMGWMVENNIYIMMVADMTPIWWLESATNIVITISICFFCAVFVSKLGYAIKQRSRLGVRDFGPMKVIFVCGCQTMTIPALFSILQYCIVVPELSSNVLTLVTISLPLSSIWAGAALENRQRIPSTDPGPRRNLWQALAFGADITLRSKHVTTELTSSTAAQTLCYSDQTASKISQDSDVQLGIAVEHDISVKSTRREDDYAV